MRPMVIYGHGAEKSPTQGKRIILQVDVSRPVSSSGTAPAKLIKPPLRAAEPADFGASATPQLERHQTQVISLPVWRALFWSDFGLSTSYLGRENQPRTLLEAFFV
jgi:hypothetical protein